MLDPDGLPLTLLREADGTPLRGAGRPARRAAPGRPGLEGAGRPRAAAAARLRRRGQRRRPSATSPTGCTAAAASTGCSRRCCSASAASARCGLWSRLTGAPAPEVFHTNEGHAGFLGLERIRELVEDDGLTFDEALEAVRAATVFTTHTPVPAGIDRFARDLDRAALRRRQRRPGRPGRAGPRARRRGLPGRRPGVFNMAVMGLRLAQRANGVSQLHGDVSRDMFDGLWPGFDEPEVPIASITNGVHAPTWVAPRGRRAGRAGDRSRARTDRASCGRRDPRSRTPTSGRSRGLLRERLVVEARRRRARVLAAARRQRGRAGLDRRHPRPGRPDHRLRPAGADVQAAHADAARPGAAEGAAARPGAAGADRHRRQVAPGRRRRQEADPGDGAVRRRPRGAAPHRLPAQLRHRHGPVRSTPAATSG